MQVEIEEVDVEFPSFRREDEWSRRLLRLKRIFHHNRSVAGGADAHDRKAHTAECLHAFQITAGIFR
jgi:hypothetical protein